MTSPPYALEWYEEDGEAPVLRWLREELSPQKRRALGTAMNEILQHLGPNVVQTNFGKALGGGLFEFRLDQHVKEILAFFASSATHTATRLSCYSAATTKANARVLPSSNPRSELPGTD